MRAVLLSGIEPRPRQLPGRPMEFRVQDHCLIRLLPHHPQVWVDRGATFLALGYGELAAADGYKAHLLCHATSAKEIRLGNPVMEV